MVERGAPAQRLHTLLHQHCFVLVPHYPIRSDPTFDRHTFFFNPNDRCMIDGVAAR